MRKTQPASPERVVRAVLSWYGPHARDLPWRRNGTTPWGILVSEVMLQQTPVARVQPVYEAWLARWPVPAALAADSPGAAVRLWGRLGYPRRALRLHAAATVMVARHGGRVPESYDALRTLPGIGDYTAAAVASFAYRHRHAVLDTNVRRFLARVVDGRAHSSGTVTAAERRTATALLPADPQTAARWAVASMELGALVCRARAPRCGDCPVRGDCVWHRAGHPTTKATRAAQRYEGTDRQARGHLLEVLRSTAGAVPAADLTPAWPDSMQRARALDGLVADGLVEPIDGDAYRLPAG